MYALPKDAGAFRDVTEGDNGAYSAGPGWDACTGWGSPVGGQLLAALSAQGAATTLPQQSSIDLSGPAVEQGRRV
jgi:kumamolisin